MPQATSEDLLWARTGKKPIVGVTWTNPEPGATQARDRIVKSIARGERLMKLWKEWKERHGWTVTGSLSYGYRATLDGGKPEVITVRRYDPETMERVR